MLRKETKNLLVGIVATLLFVGVIGGGIAYWAMNKTPTTPATTGVVCGDGVCHLPEYQSGSCPQDCQASATTNVNQQPGLTSGLVYADLSGNLMDKAKFATNPSSEYSGVQNQSVKFYDVTKNPQNDPRTNVLAVPDFQIIALGGSGVNGALSATKMGIAGHTYVYYFENTTGSYYDVTGTFMIPANINGFVPSFDFGNILAPSVGTLKTDNESNKETDTTGYIHKFMGSSINSSTGSTDFRIVVGSNTYAEFLRIWGEYASTKSKAKIIGVSVIQKYGPTTGVQVDTSDEKNPIITVQELSAQFPITFTYYIQGDSIVGVGHGNYTIYADDWNAVPGKFGSKIQSMVELWG